MMMQKENEVPRNESGKVRVANENDKVLEVKKDFVLHEALVRVEPVKFEKDTIDTDTVRREADSIKASIENTDWKVQIAGYKQFRALAVQVSKSDDADMISELSKACSSFPSKIVKSTSCGAIRATQVLEACACISAFVEIAHPRVDKATFSNLLQLCMVKDKAVVWKAAVATVETVIEFAASNSCETIARLLLQHLEMPKDSKKKKSKKKGKRNNTTSHARCLWIQFITAALRHWNGDWDGKKWCNVPVPLGSTPLSLESIATETVQDKGKNIRKKMSELVSVIRDKFPPVGSRIMRKAPSNFKLSESSTSTKTPSESSSRSMTRSTTGRKKNTTSRKRARAQSDGIMASSTKSNKKRKSERKPLRRCQSDGDMKKKNVVDFGM